MNLQSNQSELIRRINDLHEKFDQKGVDYFELITRALSLIDEIAPNSRYTDLAKAALNEPGDPTNGMWIVEKQKALRFKGILAGLKDDIGRDKVFQPDSDVPAFRMIEKLLSRFHKIAKKLGNRYAGRDTIDIADEYDVQDLLHALLLVNFDDVRNEEWTPSYAGGSNRMDFLLKRDKIVIEVKITRANHADKEIGNELLVDIPHYKEHSDCRTLVCFLYDPDQHIKNFAGLQYDLERNSTDEFTVAIFVSPN